MAAEPIASVSPSSAPRRATGEIPLSWAVPAEAVSAAPPPSPSSVSLVTVFAGLAVVAIAGFAIMRFMGPGAADEPVHHAPVSLATPPTPPPSAIDAVAGMPPPPPPSVQPVAVAEAPVVSSPATSPANSRTPVTAAGKAKARALVARARRAAKDGDVPGARDLAEDAVVADPGCSDCWKTVALLRKKTGDRAGAAVARARADGLEGTP